MAKWFLIVLSAFVSATAFSGCTADFGRYPNQIQLGFYTKDCVDVEDAVTTPGAHLLLYACDAGKLSQQWMLTPVANGYDTIVNANSKLCMAVSAVPNDQGPGEAVIQATCNSANPDMLWKLVQAPEGVTGWNLMNQASGQCLDDPYGGTELPNTLPLQQYTCNPFPVDPAQGWIIQPVQLGNTP